MFLTKKYSYWYYWLNLQHEERAVQRRNTMKQQASPKNIDLFKYTFRSSMPLTDDYVFHAVFGRDTEESRAALIEILNIIL